MLIKKLRLQKGWSQQQLAEFSGLSVRTIQRIERGHKAGNESLKSLAAVFETNIQTLRGDKDMAKDYQLSDEEQQVFQQVQDIKDFFSHVLTFMVVVPCLYIFNIMLTPEVLWINYLVIGWTIGLALHGIWAYDVISFLSPDWEKKEIEKRLGRKL
ncbi:helix-turn-helix domain-containing protein [Thalassotalea sp. Y01]|uniref:2TM domain-containing protein n=1 Tax=Thalassotalea sp. Y01 TaxID=2729613 RepID=UPI00145C5B4A|nr:helix-turn-helix domain-containing protein [Thalassotalea sp. Y01]